MAKINKERLEVEVEKYEFLYNKQHRDYKNRILADQTWACIASDIGIEGELWVWLCSRHPLMPTDAQIIFSSLPSRVAKGTWLLVSHII